MLCRKCGVFNPDGMKFCGSCAATLILTCPKCKSYTPANFEYCGQCARKLSAALNESRPTLNNIKKEEAERRQITVLFCDIVNASKISSYLDPEDLRDIMRMYRETCSEVVSRYEGHVAQHLGDGMLVYFGHPVAHEDDARRAAQAGLDIIEQLSVSNFSVTDTLQIKLSVRIGIHTGLVVIGGIGDDKRAMALGDTPNIASRIQNLARENTVLISSSTHQLLKNKFNTSPLGQYTLKGFADPIELFHVRYSLPRESIADTVLAASHTPLIGREHESGILLECLAQARNGRGQVILLNGESGIGKTRMVQMVYERAIQEDCTLLEINGSPNYQNSFFFPVVKMIKHILGISEDLSAKDKFIQIEKALYSYGMDSNTAAPALSDLLSVPLEENHRASMTSTPQQKKKLIMDFLLEVIQSKTRQHFVLFVAEDLQWVDHSTIEFLTMLISQPDLNNIYIIYTFRGESPVPLFKNNNSSLVILNHLTRTQAGELVHLHCNFKSIPKDVLSNIIDLTDGNPLYIEELTKTILDSNMLQEKSDHFELTQPMIKMDIPPTLHDSLISRLDSLGEVKELAQLASILGREFSYELLSAVSMLDEHCLRTGLTQLVNTEFLLQYGQPPNSRYIFRHALLCDAAYQSLLKKTRQNYHLQITVLIKTRFNHIIHENPEIYAHHCTEAGKLSESLEYWLNAGQKASRQSANYEAIVHFSRGISIINELPDTQENQKWELSFQTSLGLAASICKGYAAPEVENSYSRAKNLCSRINEVKAIFPVLCGLWEFYIVRARLDTAMEIGNQIQTIAENSKISEFLSEARRILGTTLFWRGQLKEALQQFEISTHIPTSIPAISSFASHCQNAQVATLANSSSVLWLLGKPDHALTQANRALSLANHLAHPFSQAYALQFLATIYQLRGDRNKVSRITDTQITLSEKYQFPFWAATGKMMRSWASSNIKDIEKLTVEFQQALREYRQSGNNIAVSYFHSLLTQLLNNSGNTDSAKYTIEQALSECDTSGENYFRAELLRLKGELDITSTSQPDFVTAEEYFSKALEVANQQKAYSLTLRILNSFYHLVEANQTEKNQLKEIYNLLTNNLQKITGGSDTEDIILARHTLSRMERRILSG